MVELGINVWRFGGGVESVAGAELVADISVVGLVYGFVFLGVGLVYGFRSWLWVQIGFQVVGFQWAWALGLIVVVFGLRFETWV